MYLVILRNDIENQGCYTADVLRNKKQKLLEQLSVECSH